MTMIYNTFEPNTYEDRPLSVSTAETYWGYIVRCQSCDRTMAILLQWVAAIIGVSLLVSVLGLWALPGSTGSFDVMGFKLAITTMMCVVGTALIWFASHGTHYEVQIDLARQELRESLRANSGKARIQNRVKFENIDAVFIDQSAGEDAKAQLLVRLASSSRAIVVATDYKEHLLGLHNRLHRDILGASFGKTAKANRGFMFEAAKGLIPSALAA